MEIVTKYMNELNGNPCNECRNIKAFLVAFNKYGLVEWWICKECLEKALTLINKEIENEES